MYMYENRLLKLLNNLMFLESNKYTEPIIFKPCLFIGKVLLRIEEINNKTVLFLSWNKYTLPIIANPQFMAKGLVC